MTTTFPVFDGILRYELNGAERYRRYVSLVLVHSPTDHEGLKAVVGPHMRNSDAVASYDHTIAVLMAETDKHDALCAINRYNDALRTRFDMRFSVVTFPADDTSAESMMSTAERRLHMAKNGGEGNVVFEG